VRAARFFATFVATVAVVLVSTMSPAVASAQPTWSTIQAVSDWTQHSQKQHKDAGTITIYRTQIDGTHCFRANATVDVAPEPMMEVAMDIEGTMEWASTANVTRAGVLGRSGSSMDYYQLMDVPGWTMTKDRYWFLRGTVRKEGGGQAFTWERLDDGGPYASVYEKFVAAYPKAIEPPINAGGWQFTPSGDETEINYYICSDAGGTIPENVQVMATTTTLPDTVGDLVREARTR